MVPLAAFRCRLVPVEGAPRRGVLSQYFFWGSIFLGRLEASIVDCWIIEEDVMVLIFITNWMKGII